MSFARINTLLMVLVASTVLVVGCGESSTAPPDGAISPTGSAISPTMRAQAIAYAHAVNLRAVDVPGLIGSRRLRGSEIRSGPFGAVIEKCDGTVARTEEAIGILSENFARNNERYNDRGSSNSLLPIESVQSAVYLMRSSALASQEFVAADSARARACLKRLDVSEDSTTTREGSTVREPFFTHIEVSALPSPLRGVRVYGLRMTADSTLEVPGTTGRSNYYEDFLGFVIGRAVITLHATGDPRPFSLATEGRLLSLLHSRAEARKLS